MCSVCGVENKRLTLDSLSTESEMQEVVLDVGNPIGKPVVLRSMTALGSVCVVCEDETF